MFFWHILYRRVFRVSSVYLCSLLPSVFFFFFWFSTIGPLYSLHSLSQHSKNCHVISAIHPHSKVFNIAIQGCSSLGFESELNNHIVIKVSYFGSFLNLGFSIHGFSTSVSRVCTFFCLILFFFFSAISYVSFCLYTNNLVNSCGWDIVWLTH